MASQYYTIIQSPVGDLLATSNGKEITGLFPPKNTHFAANKKGIEDSKPFKKLIQQLEQYFSGKRSSFDLALSPAGTQFKKSVWRELQKIPQGTTLSYGQLAAQLGNAKASRAVGTANGKNPICIIIPCHRVIAGNGKLGGYNGGIKTKQWLLDHEKSSNIKQAA